LEVLSLSKVCFLGDTHFGLKNGDIRFQKYYEKCYLEWFFLTTEQLGIKQVFQFGDLFDNRRAVDTVAISMSKTYFFNRLRDLDIDFHALIGNHDLPLKESLEHNSPMQLLKEYSNITLYDKPTEIPLGKFWVSIIPWIAKSNYDEIMGFVEDSTSDLLFAHLELANFCMQKGVKSHGGMSPDIFKKYKHVYSGHYHSKSSEGNITYLGVPYEMTWADDSDPKGIHIFDTETGELEFIQNPFTMFQKVYYDEDNPVELDFTTLTDKFVRLYSINMKDRKKYDKFIDSINNSNPHELKVIEEFISVESTTGDNIDVKDTPALIENYIDGMDTDLDKEKLKTMMRRFYIEAQNINGE
jgi:DNA repair exonuclease SbcCD nuclease subunit